MRALKDFSKLCIHTQTTKPWSLEECIKHYSKSGVSGISIWRHLLEGKDLKKLKLYWTPTKWRLFHWCGEVFSLSRGQ